MKTRLLIGALCLFLGVSLTACGVPQEEHNAVLADRAAREAEVASLQSELNGLREKLAEAEDSLLTSAADLTAAEGEIASLKSQVSSVQGQLAGAQARSAQVEQQLTALEGGQIGNLAPRFQLTGLDGRVVSLSDLRGRPVMLNFWATWCGPCHSEMPFLQQAYNRWQDKGLVLLTVNLRESAAAARQFIQDGNYSFPVLLDASGDMSGRYSIAAIPSTFFIAENGAIIDKRVGSFQNLDTIEASLAKISRPPEIALFTPEMSGLRITINGVTAPAVPGAFIARITWDWGDGLSEDHWFPASHNYKAAGTYVVQVTAYQRDGLSTSRSVTVQVSG